MPTRRSCGGTWSTPAMSPLTIEGIAPIRMTKYTVASDRPNQMIAAGTQATEGSTCRPEMIGPTARRSGRTSASSRPIGVPTTIAMRKPTIPRSRLVRTASCRRPLSHAVAESAEHVERAGHDVGTRLGDHDVELPDRDQDGDEDDRRQDARP